MRSEQFRPIAGMSTFITIQTRDAPPRCTPRRADSLDRPYRFDAEFFGISPREAAQIDPQQRLVARIGVGGAGKCGHRAREHRRQRGLRRHRRVVQPTIAGLQREHGDGNDPYIMSGSAVALVSNRISYILDLHGPSYSLDTACSSALVAVHQACESPAPRTRRHWRLPAASIFCCRRCATIGFSRARMLSPTGHCHTFDAARRRLCPLRGRRRRDPEAARRGARRRRSDPRPSSSDPASTPTARPTAFRCRTSVAQEAVAAARLCARRDRSRRRLTMSRRTAPAQASAIRSSAARSAPSSVRGRDRAASPA